MCADECLYNTERQLLKRLRTYCKDPATLRRRATNLNVSAITWSGGYVTSLAAGVVVTWSHSHSRQISCDNNQSVYHLFPEHHQIWQPFNTAEQSPFSTLRNKNDKNHVIKCLPITVVSAKMSSAKLLAIAFLVHILLNSVNVGEIFTVRRYASAVYAMALCLFVCLSQAGLDFSVWRPWAGSLLDAPTHPQMLGL